MAGTNQSLRPKMGTFGDQVVDADFSFQMNGVFSPTATSGKGVVSVTRTGVGAFTVVLNGNFIQLLSGTATIMTATGTSADVVMLVAESTSAKLGTDAATGFSTIKVSVFNDASAAVDEAANTYTWINLSLQLSLSPLNR